MQDIHCCHFCGILGAISQRNQLQVSESGFCFAGHDCISRTIRITQNQYVNPLSRGTVGGGGSITNSLWETETSWSFIMSGYSNFGKYYDHNRNFAVMLNVWAYSFYNRGHWT